MTRETPVNVSRARFARGYGARMWTAKLKEDTELLTLFEQSGRNVQRASCLLRDLIAEYPEQPELADEVRGCEHEGDRIAHEILSRLAARGGRQANLEAADVHALTGALDDIVDYAEEAADQLGLYGVEAPMEQAEEITAVLVAAAEQVAISLRGLRNGLDVGPRLVEIHRLENDADQLQRAAVADLFATGIDPMMVIRWKDIFETLESAVDACERVANVLEGIMLKRPI
jgi:predicted phosphate transport protein (TIGR00153 family)